MSSPPRKREKTLESLVKDGRNNELQEIISQSAPSDLFDYFGNTPLHFAAKYNNTEIVRFLLNRNHPIDPQNSSGATPVFMAARNRSSDATQILLNAGADVFTANSATETTLGVLMEHGEILSGPGGFECLIRAIKRSDVGVDDMAAAMIAAKCHWGLILSLDDAKVTKQILKRVGTLGNRDSRSAVRFAMDRRDVPNVYALLHFGPDTGSRKTAFFERLDDVAKGPDMNLQTFESFVSMIGVWNLVDKDRLDFFNEIFVSASQEAVRVLLNNKIDVMFKEKFGVDLISGVFSNRNVDMIALMRNRKFDVNAQGLRKLSALHFALRSGSEQNVQFLIDRGADINIRDETGKTPLLDTHAWNDQRLGRILLQHGADVQARDNAGYAVWKYAQVNHIRDYIIPQLVILEAQGTAIRPASRMMLEDKKFVDAYNMCCAEREKLREYQLKTNSVTLLDVLSERSESMAAKLGGEDFTDIVRRYCEEEDVIRYYSETLGVKLKRALVLYWSKINLARIVSRRVGYDVGVGHLVVEKIFELISYPDLCALAESKMYE